MIFKGKKSGIIHNFTMNVDPGYKYIEKFRGGVHKGISWILNVLYQVSVLYCKMKTMN